MLITTIFYESHSFTCRGGFTTWHMRCFVRDICTIRQFSTTPFFLQYFLIDFGFHRLPMSRELFLCIGVFCQAIFPNFTFRIPSNHRGEFPVFSGIVCGGDEALPSWRMRACSMRYLGPSNINRCPWCTSRSIMAAAIWVFVNRLPHFENSMFVVRIRLLFS